jgi:hypothetical protein
MSEFGGKAEDIYSRLAGQEHGRTIPITDIGLVKISICFSVCREHRPSTTSGATQMDKSVSGTEPGQRQLNGPQTTGRDYRNLSKPQYAIARDDDVMVPMRDGGEGWIRHLHARPREAASSARS